MKKTLKIYLGTVTVTAITVFTALMALTAVLGS